MPLNSSQETKKLRTRSPFSSARLLCVIALVVVFNVVLLGAYLLFEDVRGHPNAFLLRYLMGFFILVGAAIVFAFWRQTRLLIKHGVVCRAEVTEVIRWPRGYWTIVVAYYASGRSRQKAFRLATHHAAVIDQTRNFYVVVVPRKPKIVEPLYMLARFGRESKRVLAGQSGLDES